MTEPKKPVNTLGQKLTVQAMQTNTGVFNPVIYQQFKVMANDMASAGALPSGLNASQALVIMQFGSELGIKPFTALQSIYIVNGKLTLYGSMVISRLTETGYKVEYKDVVSDKEDENSCTVTVTKGKDTHEETYTFKMARLSGYTSSKSGIKIGWVAGTNRKLKLRYGAVSVLIKSKLPHLLNGAEIKEVWEDVDVNPTIILDEKGDQVDIDEKDIKKIMLAKDEKELITICQQVTKQDEKLKSQVLKHYNVRKAELVELSTEVEAKSENI